MNRDVIIRLAICVVLGVCVAPPIVHAQIICGSESADTVATEAYPCPGLDSIPPVQPFIRYRPGTQGTFRFRDLEFFWHDQNGYGTIQVDALRQTLDNFGRTLSENPGRGHNPLGIDAWDFHLIYNYFRRVSTPYNSSDPDDFASVKIGKERGIHPLDAYPDADRSHVDTYIVDPTAIDVGGQYPAQRIAVDEDVSTNWPAEPCSVRHANSIDVEGPAAAARIDLNGTGWTAPDKIHNVGFNHEFQHSIPGQGDGVISEFFSAGAEVIGGIPADFGSSEVPYTWSLMAGDGSVSCTQVRGSDSNYQGRTAFMAYLAYNFRGNDTTATIGAIEDDLMRLWVKSGVSSLKGLRDQLGDAAYPAFAGKNYFKGPGGAPLSNDDRIALLLHNWRVANYVNNSSLEEGQYGFLPQFGFSPGGQLKAWQEFDGCAEDDIVAIPAEVVIRRAQTSRETTFVRERAYHGSTFPMALQMYGSEYWVVRADPGAYVAGQDLIVRVSPLGIHREETSPTGFAGNPCTNPPSLTKSARLLASVVAYAVPAGQEAAPLWQHPEWARLALAPRWVDVDSLASDLEFEVPSYGDSIKAVLVVLSLADGPSQSYLGANGLGYSEVLRYRISAGLRRGAPVSPAPVVEVADAGAIDESPVWSPDGDTLIFVRTTPTSAAKLYRKRVGGTGVQLVVQGSPSSERQTEPSFSPRGDYVAFTKRPAGETETEVWVYNVKAGADLRRLVTRNGAEREPTFGSNGRFVAYLSTFVTVDDTLNEIRRLRLDGTADTLLYQRLGSHDIHSLRSSPDGKWIWFLANDSLYAVGAESPVKGRVIARPDLLAGRLWFDLPPALGQLATIEAGEFPYVLRCSYYCQSLCGNQGSTTLHLPFQRIALADTVHADTIGRFYVTGAEFSDPRWSPDGTRLAYVSNQNLTTDRDIFIGRPTFNRAPLLHDVEQFHEMDVYAHVPFSYDFSASDSDGEPITFQAVYLPDSATFHPTAGLFSWPNPKKAGADSVYFIVFRALDPSGGVHSYVTRFRVLPQAPGGGGCPFVDVATADGWITDNSILGRSRTGELGLDAYRLKLAPAVRDGRIRLRLRENEQELTTLDQVRLFAVDHAPGLSMTSAGGEIHWGERVPAWRVTTSKGEDITGLVSGQPGSLGWRGSPGDTVLVEMTDPATGRFGLTGTQDGGGGSGEGSEKEVEVVFDPSTGGGRYGLTPGGEPAATPVALTDATWLDRTGIRVQVPDGAGGWQDLTHWYPRANRDDTYFPGLTHATARLIFVGRHGLSFFGRLKPKSGAVTQTVLEPLVATHTRLGDARTAVGGTAEVTELAPGDSLYLEFAPPPPVEGVVREYFLVTRGVYTSNATTARLQPQAAQVPGRYALLQNVPNPFAQTTAIQFELPRAERVRLEVFDLLGRRVRTLADGEWPAGYHTVEWDRTGDAGARLRAGVYLYRLTAGSFRDHRKMVIGAR